MEVSREQVRIDEFINWYNNEATYYSTIEIGQFYPVIDMKHLIDKIAMWYEFKYCPLRIEKEDNKEVYSNELLLSSLPWYERIYFLKTRYVNYVKVGTVENGSFNLNLDENGYVIDGKENRHVIDKNMLGMHIKDVYDYISKEMPDSKAGLVRRAIVNYEIQESIKKLLYESIIYRILENKSDKEHLRRAFLFIKDFSLDPSILMYYAKEENDSMLINEIEEYLNVREDKKLVKVQ